MKCKECTKCFYVDGAAFCELVGKPIEIGMRIVFMSTEINPESNCDECIGAKRSELAEFTWNTEQ